MLVVMDNKTWLVGMVVAAGFVAVAIVAFSLMLGEHDAEEHGRHTAEKDFPVTLTANKCQQ
jgi:hypothetical protein